MNLVWNRKKCVYTYTNMCKDEGPAYIKLHKPHLPHSNTVIGSAVTHVQHTSKHNNILYTPDNDGDNQLTNDRFYESVSDFTCGVV